MSRLIPLLAALLAAVSWAAEKPTLTFKPLSEGEDERPVITRVVAGPQGTDYALKLEFNKVPWGEECHTRCANATLFLDTDNSKATGLKLEDAKAAETGADLAIVVQGTRQLREGSTRAVLKVKVLQFAEDARHVEEGQTLAELDPVTDAERVLSDGNSVFLLIDANLGNQPAGKQLRVVYHPPESPALVGVTRGLAVKSGRVEIFKDGKLTNPTGGKKKKSDYEKF